MILRKNLEDQGFSEEKLPMFFSTLMAVSGPLDFKTITFPINPFLKLSISIIARILASTTPMEMF